MAKNKCPACGNEVTGDEESCLECGHPIAPSLGKELLNTLPIPLAAFIFVVILQIVSGYVIERYLSADIRTNFEQKMRGHPTFGGVWREQGAKVLNVTWVRVDVGLLDYLLLSRDYNATVEVSFKGSIHNAEIYVKQRRHMRKLRLTWEVNGDEAAAFAFLAEH